MNPASSKIVVAIATWVVCFIQPVVEGSAV